jgi:HSP20 family protein
MANIIRRRQPGELAPGAGMGRLDPMQWMHELLRFDPFQQMLALPLAEQGIFAPDFEVKETPDAFVFKADLPGVKEEELEVSLTGNRLVVSGRRESERREENERYYASERSYGSFTRAFTLPEGIDGDKVRAQLESGVLTLTVPKRPETQPKKIDIKAEKKESRQPPAKA